MLQGNDAIKYKLIKLIIDKVDFVDKIDFLLTLAAVRVFYLVVSGTLSAVGRVYKGEHPFDTPSYSIAA